MAKEHNPVYLYQLSNGREVYIDESGVVHTSNPNKDLVEKIHKDWETVETYIPESEKCL